VDILGVSCYYHDSAAALLRDGELIAAADEERFSRVKHDFGFPRRAIRFCLDRGGIDGPELDYVVFYEKPLVKFERILMTTLATYPQSWKVFRESMVAWFNEKLWIKGRLLTELDIPADKLLFVDHHMSHAASAFFCSPFEQAAIMTMDGVGEWTTTALGEATGRWTPRAGKPTAARSTGNQITLHRELRFPHSLGLLYSAFTAFLGFRVNSGEYKVMGMAPYGRPTRLEDVYRVLKVGDDGSFRLDMDYFSFHRSASRTYNSKFVDLFGIPRRPETPFFTPTTLPDRDDPDWNDELAERNQGYADIAASVQRATEDVILAMAREAHRLTGLDNLCMAGGVALNSVANGRIARESPFKRVFIQPAAGDSGGALGAALYAYHVLLGHPRSFVMEHAYWGKAYPIDLSRTSLESEGFAWQQLGSVDANAERIVEALLQGKVIGLYQGRFEWGPRALGNRSILADPRTPEMKDIVNSRIKFREPFRPFAPVVLEDRAGEYYQGLGSVEESYPLRYMLMVYPVAEDKAEAAPAVTHCGGTGRLQTLRREWNPLYYRILELFSEATGVPILLNTSFNLRGEPIVASPQDALRTFRASGIDTLYLDGFLVDKPT
jgi:carbamoyltransferase